MLVRLGFFYHVLYFDYMSFILLMFLQNLMSLQIIPDLTHSQLKMRIILKSI
jgi:hypothetical protein